MKFLSFARYFGNQGRGRRPSRKAARRTPRSASRPLWLEGLESRVLLNNDTPFIVSVTPVDGSAVTSTNHPDIKIVYSEKMVVTAPNNVGIGRTGNYFLFDRDGGLITI